MRKWLYTYGKHTETVTDEQKEAMQKISMNGSYEEIKTPPTPIEAIEAKAAKPNK